MGSRRTPTSRPAASSSGRTIRSSARRARAGVPWLLAEGPNGVRHPTPTMGQHSEEVLGELLGLDGGEVAALRAAGVLTR